MQYSMDSVWDCVFFCFCTCWSHVCLYVGVSVSLSAAPSVVCMCSLSVCACVFCVRLHGCVYCYVTRPSHGICVCVCMRACPCLSAIHMFIVCVGLFCFNDGYVCCLVCLSVYMFVCVVLSHVSHTVNVLVCIMFLYMYVGIPVFFCLMQWDVCHWVHIAQYALRISH